MKFALALAALVTASSASAAVVSFRVGENGYTGGRETYVQQANPNAALGAETAISIDASDGGGVSQALIGFDGIVGASAIPAGAIISNAKLELTVDSAGSGLTMYRMLSDWSEATSTWNSLVNGIQADGVEASSTASLSIGANNSAANVFEAFIVLDVTADVQAWANGTANFGWAMLPFIPNGTNGIDFITKEDLAVSSRPLLTVTYTVIPEPTGLAALMVAGLLAVRRR